MGENRIPLSGGNPVFDISIADKDANYSNLRIAIGADTSDGEIQSLGDVIKAVYVPAADENKSGIVNATNQIFSGNKTFLNSVYINQGSIISNGLTVDGNSIMETILPNFSNSYDLGNNTRKWRFFHTNGSIYYYTDSASTISNPKSFITFFNSDTLAPENNHPHMTYHNTGDGNGAFIFCPSVETKNIEDKSIGLYISKNGLYHYGKKVITLSSESGAVGNKGVPAYVDANGIIQQCSNSLDVDIGGNAASATQLLNPRTITVALNSTTPAAFNGTQNINIPVSGILPLANGGTGNSTGMAEYLKSQEITTDIITLNNIITPGFYHCLTDSTARVLNNCPTQYAFTLIVTKSAGYSQLLIEYQTGAHAVYQRNCYNNNWGNWYQIYIDGSTPMASATTEGIITTGTQTIEGNKTFLKNINAPSFTGDLIGNANTATTLSSTLTIAKGGTGATTALDAITALGGASIASLGKSIPLNADLDTYRTPGTYYSESANITASLNNHPPSTGSGFKMIVSIGYGTGRIWQFAFSNNTKLIYVRYISTGDWSDWETFAFASNLTYFIKRNSTTSAVGSASLPVYIASNGTVAVCTGSSIFSNLSWNGGTSSGPTLSVTVADYTRTSAAIPSAGESASGIITTGAQTISGAKTFKSTISGSISGNAATATTLQNARNLCVALDSTTAVTFNGGANVTNIPVSGVLSVANGGTGTSSLAQYSILVGNGTSAISQLGANSTGAVYKPSATSGPTMGPLPVSCGGTGMQTPAANGFLITNNLNNISVLGNTSTGTVYKTDSSSPPVIGTLPVSCGGTGMQTAANVFSVFSLSNGSNDALTISTTVVGQNRTVDIPAASSSQRGIVTTGAQTFTGVKTFNSTISGSISGNAATATKLSSAKNIALSGDVTGSVSFDGSSAVTITTTLKNSGVSANSYGPSSNVTLDLNTTSFTIPYITIDAQGRITTASNKTITTYDRIQSVTTIDPGANSSLTNGKIILVYEN